MFAKFKELILCWKVLKGKAFYMCPFCGEEGEIDERYIGRVSFERETGEFTAPEPLVHCSNKECPCYETQFTISEWNGRSHI